MDGKLGFMFLHFRSLRNQMCLGANLLCKQTMPNGLTLDAFHKPLWNPLANQKLNVRLKSLNPAIHRTEGTKGISAISIKPLEDSICDCLERFSFPITHRSIMSACHLKVCMEEYTYFGKKFISIYLFPNFKNHFVSLTLELIIQVGNLSLTAINLKFSPGCQARFQTQLCVVTCNFPRLIHLFILRRYTPYSRCYSW